MSSPDKQIKTSKHIFGNVDDSRQYTNDWIDNELLYIINKLIDTSLTWGQFLYISGKCSIFVLQWDFTPEGQPI